MDENNTDNFVFLIVRGPNPKKVTEGEVQREVVSYAFNNNALVNRYYDRSKIESLYGAVSTDYTQINLEMDRLNNYFA